MRACPGTLDDEWLDGEANIPIEDELVQVNVLTTPVGELMDVMGRGAAEIRVLRSQIRLMSSDLDAMRRELKALEEL